LKQLAVTKAVTLNVFRKTKCDSNPHGEQPLEGKETTSPYQANVKAEYRILVLNTRKSLKRAGSLEWSR